MKQLLKVAGNANRTLECIRSIRFTQDGMAHATDIDVHASMPVTVSGLQDTLIVPLDTVKAALAVSKELRYADGRLNGIRVDAISPEDWPIMEEPSELEAQCELTPAGLQRVALAMAVQDIRYYLNGICLDFQTGTLTATDGHRLHAINSGSEVPVQPIAGDKPNQFIVPRFMVDLALSVKLKEKIRVSIYRTSGLHVIVMHAGNLRIMAKEIDGRFPDYSRVIPNNAPVRCKMPAKGLKAAAETAEKIHKAQGSKIRGAQLHGHGELVVKDTPISIDGTDVIDQDWHSGFNVAYLSDMAACFDGDIELRQERTPHKNGGYSEGPLLAKSGEFVAVVMPMRA